MTRKALGRGLGALLSAEGTATASEETNELAIELIDPSPLQPRSFLDEGKLDELAKSIRTNGVVQPVLLRRKGSRFELIAGERRWRAAAIAGLIKIPAEVRNVPHDKVLESPCIENIPRATLKPNAEARSSNNLCANLWHTPGEHGAHR